VLVHTIRKGKCILMLGPETAEVKLDGQSKMLSQSLANLLSGDLDSRFKEHIDPSNLLEVAHYLQPDLGKIKLQMKIRDFYTQHNSASTLTSDFHRDLAALPFYLSIHSSPDEMFSVALKEQNKHPKIGWYNYKEKKSTMESFGTASEPMLFYLYGSIKDEESLVATENDLLDFLVSIMARGSLPERLINELQAPDKSFLFLGFGFKHWYLRILLHILEIKNKDNRSFALEEFNPSNAAESKSTVLFFREGPYRIHFFEKGFEEFAAEMRRRFEVGADAGAEVLSLRPEKRPRVFLCHANEDKPFAASLHGQLKAAGLDPWLDKENLRGGDRWDEMIQKIIKKEIDYFLVLQSNTLKNKVEGYVHKEIYEALERQKTFKSGIRFIIPLQIDDGGELEELGAFHYNAIKNENDLAELVRLIERDYKKRGN
ncbi:MAG TPA: toll/interleukin-1 receptor domain-containing protein, partial [Candidatus Deferrimicrobium sp.]|nr:toll/interleukin-1 receptor domain-containing protein [Candidatus Deferrimicrobium sp.]